MIAVVAGMLPGPEGLGLLGLPPRRSELGVLEILARLTVAVAVTSIALRVDPGYSRRRARALLVILGPVMVSMWLASGFLAWLALPVSVVPAFLRGAILAPTDPVLANSIVTGGPAERFIPARLRALQSAEADINAGSAALLVVPMRLFRESATVGSLLSWLTRGVLQTLVRAIVVGYLERRGRAAGDLEDTCVLTITLVLTACVLGTASLLGTNDILAVFIAAVAYNHLADPDDEAANSGSRNCSTSS